MRIRLENNVCDVPGNVFFFVLISVWLLETFKLQICLMSYLCWTAVLKTGFSEGMDYIFLISLWRSQHFKLECMCCLCSQKAFGCTGILLGRNQLFNSELSFHWSCLGCGSNGQETPLAQPQPEGGALETQRQKAQHHGPKPRKGNPETQMRTPRGHLQDRCASRRWMVLASRKRIYSRGSQKEEILFLGGMMPQTLPEKTGEAADGEWILARIWWFSFN